MQAISCFEGLLERNLVVQTEFEFDGQFKDYSFFNHHTGIDT